MPQIVVTIDDKTYRMACDEGQEAHLEGLAKRFDKHMKQLRKAFGSIGDQRLTVMTGIMLMDQLDEAEAKLKDAVGQLEARDENGKAAADDEPEVVKRVDETARRIERLAERLAELG